VWAPTATRVEVVSHTRTPVAELDAEAGGYFSGVAELRTGDRYFFRLDGGESAYPDPASRFQPEGPHGPSQIVEPSFAWSDREWRGLSLPGQVIYELHVGTFTRDGTWRAAARELAELARLGVTVIELMPVAEFEGRFGWGYDGVDLFAPSHLYGAPDDLRAFVDRAHAVGIGVILDVVYNHFGPSGNYLRAFSPAYFTTRYENEWGDAINFDGPDAGPVRELFIANAGYWMDEYHMDGLRLDATQQIYDQSPTNVITEVALAVRRNARGRDTIVVAENEPQDTRLVRSAESGGFGLDGLWNDDFHHSAIVSLTGRREAYYSDTRGTAQEFVSAAKYGYLFQGQHYHWQNNSRGTPALDLESWRFVTFLQNHDQVANSARGIRVHELTSPGHFRAMTALLLLMPGTPMLFQGQEFASSSPFLYFADFEPELSAAVRRGRAEFLTQFPSIASFEQSAALDDPGDVRTFERCKLDFTERERHADVYALHRDLLRLRRQTAAWGARNGQRLDGAVLSPQAFVLRVFGGGSDDRALIVNLGADLRQTSFAEPLLAPPNGCEWDVEWSSEDPRYGGGGVPPLWDESKWRIAGVSATVLAPRTRTRTWTPIRRRTA
jgi:maltooligosyltrehalose trehalohydrolase